MKKHKPITLDGTVLNVPLEERLDAIKATQLIEHLGRYTDDIVTEVVFDARQLEYIASTGIRAVLFAQKMVGDEPEVIVVGATDNVRRVFDMTGISNFITFKDEME